MSHALPTMSWLNEVKERFQQKFTNKPAYRDWTMVAGIDIDGQLRGKVLKTDKLVRAEGGIGFCSVVFGWDINDDKYCPELGVSNSSNGYRDLEAIIDVSSFRNYPFQPEKQTSLALVYFANTDGTPLAQDPRGLLKSVIEKYEGLCPKAGMELEFFNYNETGASVLEKGGRDLVPLTVGMHGYSVYRPIMGNAYWTRIMDYATEFCIEIECLHSETGPGVYEVALEYTDACLLADRATLFKLACRKAGSDVGNVIPCFMAKPQSDLPGNSGHLHVSLVDESNRNVFSSSGESAPPFPEVKYLSETGQSFLAGVLEGLSDVMILFAPNVNSYKRLDPQFWAPTTVSWGAEHRLTSIRLIDAKPNAKGCRLEVRIPGADVVPHFALAAIFALGQRGMAKKLALTTPPTRNEEDFRNSPKLPCSMAEAISAFSSKSSISRELFGDEFVDHYTGTRLHELEKYNRAVTDWEKLRYFETT